MPITFSCYLFLVLLLVPMAGVDVGAGAVSSTLALDGVVLEPDFGGRPRPRGFPSGPSTFSFGVLSFLPLPGGRPLFPGVPIFFGSGVGADSGAGFGSLALGRPRPLLTGFSASSSSPSSRARLSPVFASPLVSAFSLVDSLAGVAVLSFFPPFRPLPPELFSSTSISETFFTTSLPSRAIATAGSDGSPDLLMVFPLLDVTETWPSVFLSETSPSGCAPPQDHETVQSILSYETSIGRLAVGLWYLPPRTESARAAELGY